LGNALDELPANPPDLFEAIFDLLEFVVQMVKEDNLFAIFSYNISRSTLVTELPDTITDSNGVLDNIDKWLEHFLQVKPQAHRDDLYTLVCWVLEIHYLRS